jgi:UDP-glucose 4-epimerase
MRVLVTGATGFIGGAVVARAALDPTFEVWGSEQRVAAQGRKLTHRTFFCDLAPDTDWSDAMSGVDAVVHTAARVHVMNDLARDPLVEFRRINVEGTLALARQAAEEGARRFIFISSIKVNGEYTLPGHAFAAGDTPNPSDAYGVSKHEAEEGLRRLSEESGLELVIIRPVLVYGPGVRANFLSMMRWIHRGVPLPFGAIQNKRSLVALENLVDLIMTCIRHESAANEIFLVSDGVDLSTTVLLRRVARSLDRPARLVSVPPRVLGRVGRLLGKEDVVQRLCGSLQVDITKTRQVLGWTPPVSVDEGLEAAAVHFLEQRRP